MSSARAVPDPKNQLNNNNRNSPCTANLGRSPNDNYYNNLIKRATPRKSIDRCGSPSLSGYPSVCIFSYATHKNSSTQYCHFLM